MKHMVRLCVSLLIFCLLFYMMPAHGEANIYDEVIRLHVLAASDSTEDQTIKLYVRDALLAAMPPLIGTCRTRDEAADTIRASLPALQDVAQKTLEDCGSAAPVTLTLEEEYYPTRTYNGLAFPKGRYLSLRVNIGEAAGQNWWCVLFPSLCLSAASRAEAEQTFIAAGLTPEEYRIITESDRNATYKLRFRILEILGDLF